MAEFGKFCVGSPRGGVETFSGLKRAPGVAGGVVLNGLSRLDVGYRNAKLANVPRGGTRALQSRGPLLVGETPVDAGGGERCSHVLGVVIMRLSILPGAMALAVTLSLSWGCRSSVNPAVAAGPAAASEGDRSTAQAAAPADKPSPMERARASEAPPPEIPAGTTIRVRLNGEVDTARSRPGDRFSAVLAEPIMSDGRTLVARGANVQGVVRSSSPSGRLKGRAEIAIALTAIEVNGSWVPVSTDSVGASSGGHKKRNWTLIGGGSGLGALIGGLAGGGRGALIGAGAGAGAGTAGAALTGRKQAHIPAESVLVFRLREPLRV